MGDLVTYFTYFNRVLDLASFDRSLSGCRDSGFFMFGQLCKFIHRLASRIAQPASIPICTDWFGLLSFELDDLVPLSPSEFLKRLKLRGDLDAACRVKAERDTSSKPGSLAVAELSSKAKEQFGQECIDYILYLLRVLQKHTSLTSNIVKGMASFDPQVLFSTTSDLASRCFGEIYSCFLLQKWVAVGDLTSYRDEYLEFVDHLKVTQPLFREKPLSVPDVVAHLIPNASLRARSRLLYIFELSCLCLTEESVSLPSVSFSGVDTSDLNCPYSDAILPVQSFLSVVPHGVGVCTDEEVVSELLALKDSMLGLDFSSSYDPWEFVDYFGRKQIYSTLMAAHGCGMSSSGESTSRDVSLTESQFPQGSRRLKRIGFVPNASATNKPSSSRKGSRRGRNTSSKSADEAAKDA